MHHDAATASYSGLDLFALGILECHIVAAALLASAAIAVALLANVISKCLSARSKRRQYIYTSSDRTRVSLMHTTHTHYSTITALVCMQCTAMCIICSYVLCIQGDKKYGLMCMVASVLITGMGVTLFFNKFLIRLGNVRHCLLSPLSRLL
jgi:CHASE2 domain-containing sensor protein